MRAVLEAWARTIDDGPFSSLCWGERIAFDNPEAITLLGRAGGMDGSRSAGDDRGGAATARPRDVGQGAGDRRHAQRRQAHRRPRNRRPTRGLRGGRRRPGDADDAGDGRTGRGDEAGMGRREGDRFRRAGRTRAGAERGAVDCSSGRWAPRRCSPPHPGPTAWRAPRWISIPPSRTNCTTLPEPRGRRRESPNPFWRRRSGSRSATATKRARRFTDICAAT